jgi:CheY-like chemotaxis protein
MGMARTLQCKHDVGTTTSAASAEVGSELARILIVDDDADLRAMVEGILTRRGYFVRGAADGDEALEEVRQDHFDLIITDLGMPRVDGIDLLYALRASNVDADVLVVSATDSIPRAVEAVKLGAADYIAKPFEPAALEKIVRSILNGRIAQKTPAQSQLEQKSNARRSSWDRHLPSTLGRYEVVRRIGSGGMGVVYEAIDPDLGRRVALKTLHPTVLGDPKVGPEVAVRFRREAQAAARLSHPSVAMVYELGHDPQSGQLFFAMEYVEGRLLSRLLAREDRLSVERAIGIVYQIADGLAYAHRQSIVHRDIKPSNVMISPGDRVKILDFGVAKVTDSELTRPGAVIGSPAYLSPEAARGRPVDFRTDQFSLGAVFVEMLSGARVFEADDLYATLCKVLEEPTPRLEELGVIVPERLERVIGRLLEKSPTGRYADERDLLEDLAAVGEELGVRVPISRADTW